MSAATRDQLMDVAERLMADRGIRAVGLKEISVEAHQRNNSAAQYHFGSRAGLVEAMFVRRMGPVNEARASQLSGPAATAPSKGRLRALIGVQVGTLVDSVSLRGDSWLASFLAQAFADEEYRRLLDLHHEVMAPTRRLFDLVAEDLAHLPTRVRRHRMVFANTMLSNVLAVYERAGRDGQAVRTSRTALRDELVDATVGLLTAPVGAGARTTTTGPGKRGVR